MSPRLSVVIPTWQEAANVAPLVAGLAEALVGVDYEIVLADDQSPDGTADVAEALGDPRVRVLRRQGPRGLAPAVVDGVEAARGIVVAVTDADLQHDPALLPALLKAVEQGATVAVGSRFVPGGTSPGLPPWRLFASRAVASALRLIIGLPVRDALSGYFAARRETVLAARPRLVSRSFKILADLLLALDGEGTVRELPTTLRPRLAGASKFNVEVVRDLVRTVVAHHRRRRVR